MTTYNVHIYRVMRLYFPGIEANSPMEAAQIAAEKPTMEAEYTEDCEGETLSALVDVPGDEDYRQSVDVDFEAERMRKTARELLDALVALFPYAEAEAEGREGFRGEDAVADQEADDAWDAVEEARAALAKATTVLLPSKAMDKPLDDALTPLRVPVQPDLAETFGYPGEARFVGFLWEPAGNEVVFTDGSMFGSGDGLAFLAFCRHRVVTPQLVPYHLGLSDAEAEHCLVLDRHENRLWVADKYAAKAFLERQHPWPQLSPDKFVVSTDPQAVQVGLERQGRAVTRMLAFIDQHG